MRLPGRGCLFFSLDGFKMDLVPLRNLGYLVYLFKQLLRFQLRFHEDCNSQGSPSANKAATCQQDRSPKELATESYKKKKKKKIWLSGDRIVVWWATMNYLWPVTFLLFSSFSSLDKMHSTVLEISRNDCLTPCAKIMANTSVVLM